jgi:hypothetical protein
VGGVRHDGEAARVVAAHQLSHHKQETEHAGQGQLSPRHAACRPLRLHAAVTMTRHGDAVASTSLLPPRHGHHSGGGGGHVADVHRSPAAEERRYFLILEVAAGEVQVRVGGQLYGRRC